MNNKNTHPALGLEKVVTRDDALEAWTRLLGSSVDTGGVVEDYVHQYDMYVIRKALEKSLDGEIEGFGELQERLEQLTKRYISQFGDAEITSELFECFPNKGQIIISIKPQPPKSEE